MDGFDKYLDEMKQLGKYKTGKSCLYITKIEDVNLAALESIIEKSVKSFSTR